MGYTIRTQKYRYTEWVGINLLKRGAYQPNWKDQAATSELYDLEIDPEENVNRIDDDNYKNIIPTLSKKLRGGWRMTNPEKDVFEIEGQNSPTPAQGTRSKSKQIMKVKGKKKRN